MRVAKHTVVMIDYTLTNDGGNVLDTSEGQEPLSYLHGAGNIIPGLEKELEGKEVGDELQVKVAPEEGYGLRNDALQRDVERSEFEGVEQLGVGMQFQAETDEGPIVITIVNIADDVVTIDGNHPLAGEHLNFDVAIREVREATEEEVEHGHAHGAGGAEH